MKRIPVAILGATGTVGQKFIELLADHPQFEVAMVAGSSNRNGLRYGDTVSWRGKEKLDPEVARLVCVPPQDVEKAPLVFSALDSGIAAQIEPLLADAGALVVTNASAFRMTADVPLLIPEVNAEHISLLDHQRTNRGWQGGIIANPNCATAVLMMALAPLHREFGLVSVTAATLQAASGAGYPGIASLDLLDNVIPFIPTEEEKLVEESCRILGSEQAGAIQPASIKVSAMVHRVPVLDGHMVSASLKFEKTPSISEAGLALTNFRGNELVRSLPSSPEHPVLVDERENRPQTRLDRDSGRGMTATVGRLRTCPIGDLRLTVLGHNLVRGAAGAAIQNAELAVAMGYL